MNKIYKIVDGQYLEGDLYTVTDATGGKKKIVFSPSSTVTAGTVMDAEKFNQFQKNGVFYVNSRHSIDGGNSVYTIEDFEDVGTFGLFNGFKLMVDPSESCVAGAVINLLGQRYTVKKISNKQLINLSANDISKGLPFTVVYDNGAFKLQNVSYDNKLDKGAVSTDYNTAKKIEDKIESLKVKITGGNINVGEDIFVIAESLSQGIHFYSSVLSPGGNPNQPPAATGNNMFKFFVKDAGLIEIEVSNKVGNVYTIQKYTTWGSWITK